MESQVAINWDHLQYEEALRYPNRYENRNTYGLFSKPMVEYVAHFNPSLDSLKPLLENVTELYVLLLRGCESLPPANFPLRMLKSLAVLEISGSSRFVAVPDNTISQLENLEHLNLSDLLIERLPHDFFCRLSGLRKLVIRNCSKLSSLPPFFISKLQLLDLSHCTALQELVLLHGDGVVPLQVVDLSYTALTEIPSVQFHKESQRKDSVSLRKLAYKLSHLNLSGARKMKHIDNLDLPFGLSILDLSATQIECPEFRSKKDYVDLSRLILADCTSLRELPSISNHGTLEILDISGCEKLLELPADFSCLEWLTELNLSGCSGLGILREDVFDQMSRLEKLDLSRTKVKDLPSFSNLTCLLVLSLRDLELDSLETLKSLSNLVRLDLKGLSITPSQELQLDFLESLEKLEILNLSQTSVSVAQLPNMSKLASLRELILADCQRLNSFP